VTLTGVGLYADFALPDGVPTVESPDLIGGQVTLDVAGLTHGAGSLIKVANGKLAFVEVYTFGGERWPDTPRTISYGTVMPLAISMPAS
jgi:hypothetical protein